MASEWEKMVAGELYDPLDRELSERRDRARDLARALNASAESDKQLRASILGQLIPHAGDGLWIQPPFFCDYGRNITAGRNVFFNFNCVVLDVAPVTIGDGCLFGPAVQIYTATHPLSAEERRRGVEFARPVSIDSDVWVGGGAVILPGVSIGARSVIGGGSVVTKPIPADVFAAGNPCRVIREIDG